MKTETWTFAKNKKELAEKLGVSKQCITYHAAKPDSPKLTDDGYDVTEWREYLEAGGYKTTLAKMEPAGGPIARLNELELVRAAAAGVTDYIALGIFAATTVVDIPALAGINLTPDQRDRLGSHLYNACVINAHHWLEETKIGSPFKLNSHGMPHELPPQVRQAESRILNREKKAAKAATASAA